MKLKDWSGNCLEMAMANRWILLFIAASAEYRLMNDTTRTSLFGLQVSSFQAQRKFGVKETGGSGGGGCGGGGKNIEIQPFATRLSSVPNFPNSLCFPRVV